MTMLFRPVGLHELALIWDSGMRQFPPRLPHQPIFYPVANMEYATQIARDWNTKESSLAGYVTKFAVAESYLANFESHTVGSAAHVEYWIPAERLQEFNSAIQGLVSVESGFFGSRFSRMDFVCEVSTNRKAVYLNFLFWSQFDFNSQGIGVQHRDSTITHLREAWEFNHIEIPLPACG
jgi:hypothetical protein